VIVAWLLFAGCAALVLYLGSDDLSMPKTHGILAPLIEWLFPDWTAGERYLLHLRVRKLAHSVEYAVLALLAFNAVYVTLDTLLTRLVGLALLLVASVAGIDELRQAYSHSRTGSFGDVALDLAGALVALTFIVLVRRRLDRPVERSPGAA
jgi:VanZ family protein